MRLNSIGYLIKEGLRGIYTNRMMALASIGGLIACLILTGAALLFTMNMNSIVGFAENQNEVVVFLDDTVTQRDISFIEVSISENGNTFDVKYISKEQALTEQMEQLEDAASLLEGLQGAENPLPDSFRLRIRDLSLIEQTVEELAKIDGVEKVNAPFDVAATLTGVKNTVYVAGTAVITLLAAVSVIVISNTIRAAVYNRRREINIMKYVGATDWFIRLPFIVEGISLGIISSVVSFLLLWLGYDYLMRWIDDNPASWVQILVQSAVPFSSVSGLLFAAFLIGGVALGMLGSVFFVRKYLKV